MRKSKIGFFIDIFAKLSTAIFLFSSIYIYIFNGFVKFLSVSFIWGVLAQAFILSIAYMPLIPEKELSKKRYLLCNILYFIFADLVVLGFGFFFEWFSLNRPVTIIAMEITFVVVSMVVYLLMYLSAKNSAAQMNEQLKKLKQS